jgi:hypothetical protein
MAYSKIIHTKSEAVGAVPAQNSLSYGEIAINYSDGHLYIRKADNTIHKVASSDFPTQIGTLTSDVRSLTNTLNFLNLQFREAEDLDFGRGNINAIRSHNSLTYGLNNEIGANAENSLLFGVSNEAAAKKTIVFGRNNTATGEDAIAIGSYITAPTGVAEFGKWTNATTRGSTIRCGNNNVGISLSNRTVSFTDGGADTGEEAVDTLPREMYAIRRNEDEILLDVNIGGTITTCSFGESTNNGSNTSVGAAIQNNRSDTTTVDSIRKLTQAEYDALDNVGQILDSTIYIVTSA